MLKFCYERKGAISVFLTMILLPVLLLGGLTTDAARIYGAKVVISDAGEMAMNAGLAQYEDRLHDEYGLLVMAKDPESMESELSSYFEKSLSGKGVPGAENYGKVLELVSRQFEAVNLEGSQIYQSEAERQQIIEYMKYRAPVCLTELIIDKLGMLKDTKKVTEAMEAQMDFGEKMEDCQDAMEDAKLALDRLNDLINGYPDQNQIEAELHATEEDYTIRVARCLLMLSAISHYTKADERGDAEKSAESYIGASGGVKNGQPADDSGRFESYLDCMYYQAGEGKAGGLAKVLEEHAAQEPDEESSAYAEWKERMDKLEKLSTDYSNAKKSVEGYPNELRSIANSLITTHTDTLHDYRDRAVEGKRLAEEAYKKLEKVQKELKEAGEKWQTWSDKTEAAGEKAGDMKESVKDYGKFFAEGNPANDQNNLGLLMEAVKSNQIYFNEMRDILNEEQFFGLSIASRDRDTQYKTGMGRADGVTGADVDQFSQIEDRRQQEFVPNYRHTTISTSCPMERIYNYDFYERLREYCNTASEDEEKKNEVNGQLNQSKEAAKEADSETGYPDHKWEMTSSMPSVKLGFAKPEDGSGDAASLDGNVSDKKGRKSALSSFKSSIKQASSFLGALDELLTKNLENLYIAEYAMQLFSYYTVDKEDGSPRNAEDIIGISGYKLSDHKMYRAEVEYILWGNTSSAANIRYTVATIFAIRMLFNSLFAFTNQNISATAKATATAIAGAAPYLIPVVQVIIQLAYAGIETANDMSKIKNGYSVTIIKSDKSWATAPFNGDNTLEFGMDYSEYLRLFLNINMMSGKGDIKLARIADCIQVNTDFDILNGYTMLAVEAKVAVKTTFMKKVSDLTSGGWNQPGNSYDVTYQSILGY